MKKFKLMTVVVLGLIFSGYGQNKQSEKNLKMYTQVWDDIVNKGEIDKINTTYFDKNIVGISNPENIVGIEDFKAYYQNFITGFSDRKFTVVDAFAKDDRIVKHWNFKGKHTGDFFGMPATGRTVDLNGVTLVKMKDGKIAQEQDFFDNMTFLTQLGILSDPNNMSVIDNLYKAFAAGEIQKVLEAMDTKIVWNEAEGNEYADGNPYIGPDAVLNGVFARVGGEWENFTLNNIQLHEMSDDKVLATLRYTGKHKKTSKSMDAQAAHLWTLRDGKIIAFQQYVDTKQLNDVTKSKL